MFRVKHVKAAQHSEKRRNCSTCDHEIQVGESYKYVDKKTEPKNSIRLNFCYAHYPKPSQLASGQKADLMLITEGVSYSLDNAQRFMSPLDQLADFVTVMKDASASIISFSEEIEDEKKSVIWELCNWADKFEALGTEAQDVANSFVEQKEWEVEAKNNMNENAVNLEEIEEVDDEAFIEIVKEFFSEALDVTDEEPKLNLQG